LINKLGLGADWFKKHQQLVRSNLEKGSKTVAKDQTTAPSVEESLEEMIKEELEKILNKK
jgi:hypothetical protein